MYGYLCLIFSALFPEVFEFRYARSSYVIPCLLLKTIPLGDDYTTFFIQLVHSIGLGSLLTIANVSSMSKFLSTHGFGSVRCGISG